jgi:hypothetical protein
MTSNMKIVEIPDTHREDVATLLEESKDFDWDSVVVLGFNSREKTYRIRCSKIPDRLVLLGCLAEAQNHVMVNGYVE